MARDPFTNDVLRLQISRSTAMVLQSAPGHAGAADHSSAPCACNAFAHRDQLRHNVGRQPTFRCPLPRDRPIPTCPPGRRSCALPSFWQIQRRQRGCRAGVVGVVQDQRICSPCTATRRNCGLARASHPRCLASPALDQSGGGGAGTVWRAWSQRGTLTSCSPHNGRRMPSSPCVSTSAHRSASGERP